MVTAFYSWQTGSKKQELANLVFLKDRMATLSEDEEL